MGGRGKAQFGMGGGGGGLALTLVLGTHCITDVGSCGCEPGRKRGTVTDLSTLRRGAVRGAYSVGAVDFGLSSPRKAS